MRALPGAQRYAGVLFAVNYAAFGAVMILFLVFEPLGSGRHLAARADLFPAVALQAPASRGAAPMTAPLLAVDKLEVVYQRAITAVQGITLSVGAGQIVGIVGTNGAGKTTLLRAISGFHGTRRCARHRRHDPLQGRGDREPPAAPDRAAGHRRWCPSATRCSRI